MEDAIRLQKISLSNLEMVTKGEGDLNCSGGKKES